MAASILVVDDDGNIRELLRMHLSAAGYDVHVAQDAISAGYMVLRSPDRKSTRLNSSHGSISYAVFCLKKKKVQEDETMRKHSTSQKPAPDKPTTGDEHHISS